MLDEFSTKSWRRLASTVLKRSLGLRRGQNVVIETWTQSMRVAELLATEARGIGIRPVILHVPEAFFDRRGNVIPSDAYAIAPSELAALEACDGYIFLPPSVENFDRRNRLPPAHRRAYDRRVRKWSRHLVTHSVPSVYLLASSVTPSAARLYHLNLRAWRNENLRASMVSPSLMRTDGKAIARKLLRGRRVTITHPNGTHLELGLVGRQPFIDDGAVDRRDLANGRVGTTVPGGFMAVAVDERVAEGRFLSNRPLRRRAGMLDGILWTFRKGRLHHYEIGQGRRLFEESYGGAGGERERPAILEVGLNPEIHDFPLAEDQERGTVTVEIGHNDDFGGRTRGKFRQFAVLRGADLFVDGKPLLRAGRIL